MYVLTSAHTHTTADKKNPSAQTIIDHSNFRKFEAEVITGTVGNCDTLQTTFAAGNGQDGNFFTVIAGPYDILINTFLLNIDIAGNYFVYFKFGSYAGFENDSTEWIFLAGNNIASPNPNNVPTPFGLPLNIQILAGDSMSFYVTGDGLTDVNYTDGTSEYAVYNDDGNLKILEGKGVQYPWALNFSPRIWNGIIDYCPLIGSSVNDVPMGFEINTSTTSELIQLELTGEASIHSLEMKIFNVNGQQMYGTSVAERKFNLSRSNFAAGIYTVNATINDEITIRKKIIIN
jgi:hypothetical protein